MNQDDKKIEITKEQAEEIFGDRGESLAIAKKTVFCHDCFPKNHKGVEIEIEHYFVNDLSDFGDAPQIGTCLAISGNLSSMFS